MDDDALAHLRDATLPDMKSARARVVKGKIVTRAKFREGTELVIVERDARPPVEVDAEDEARILAGIAEVDAGKGIPLHVFLDRLRGY